MYSSGSSEAKELFFFDKKLGISRNLRDWKRILIKDFKFYNNFNFCLELMLWYFSFALFFGEILRG